MAKQATFAAAMKEFFGLKPGQSLQGFAAELKALSDEEKAFFRAGLEQNGYQITTPVPAA